MFFEGCLRLFTRYAGYMTANVYSNSLASFLEDSAHTNRSVRNIGLRDSILSIGSVFSAGAFVECLSFLSAVSVFSVMTVLPVGSYRSVLKVN